jgi:hypothetical protein
VAAEAARDQTLASFDSFDDRYLGAKTSDPTLDNDGNALVAGSLYFNSTDGAMKVYTGSVWVDAYAAGTMFVQKAGSTMTGPLVLYGNAANALEAVPKQQLDARFVNSAFTGKATFEASVATGAKVNLGAGANVTSNLVDGDIWIENANLRWQGNGTTYRASAVGHTHTISNITSLQTTLDAKLNITDTTYVKQDSTSGSAYLPAGTTAQRPASPAAGYIRYNSTTGKFEGFGSSWGNIGGGAAIGDTPPANPGAGDLWWNSADGRMYVYYTDANSSQWVDLSAGGAGQYLPLTGGDVTGNVAVTGETSTGSLKVNNVPILAGPAFSAVASTATNTATATWTKLVFASEEYDTANCFSTSTSRFQPTIAGYYQINGCVFSGSLPATMGPAIYKNGAEHRTGGLSSGATAYRMTVSSLVYLNGSTDYVELYWYQASGVTVNSTTGSGTYFNGYLARAA